MSSEERRLETFAEAAGFGVGESPFQVRGLAYLGLLNFIASRLPGGLGEVERALHGEAYQRFYRQTFISNGTYDIDPLMRLFQAVAALIGRPLERLIVDLSRVAAEVDARGVYRQFLNKSSPLEVAPRLPLAFNRYFPPAKAQQRKLEPGSFELELVNLPAPMFGLHVLAAEGFVSRTLELCGAGGVSFVCAEAVPGGALRGVELVRAHCRVSWREGAVPGEGQQTGP